MNMLPWKYWSDSEEFASGDGCHFFYGIGEKEYDALAVVFGSSKEDESIAKMIVDAVNGMEALKKSEKELSDAYLRIRELVGAWDTNKGGENRFEVTEAKVEALKKREAHYRKTLDFLDRGLGETWATMTKQEYLSFKQQIKAALNTEPQ